MTHQRPKSPSRGDDVLITSSWNNCSVVLVGLLVPLAFTAPVEFNADANAGAHTSLTSRADPCTPSLTDTYVFKDSMKTFLKHRNAKDPSCFDWSSDNCSSSPDKPIGFNFIPSCQRHDFGYRNAKKQNRFDEALRKRIDDQFKSDLYEECSQYDGSESWKGVHCRRIADLYYAAVRRCGDGNCLDEA
uniref:Secretory phospholipase A2 n=1 Tax=Coccidioides posadasii RMSCC 3488 TaxID=454284 RepID=A0A0J6FHX8_COCPO|nr:secretory phospholipase A2 [Coccidioides posadasii RMSCC 3488]